VVTEANNSASSKTKASLLSSLLLLMLFLNHCHSESLSAVTRQTDLLPALCDGHVISEGLTFAHYRDGSEKLLSAPQGLDTQKLYVLPTHCIYVLCMDLITNSDYCFFITETACVYCSVRTTTQFISNL
jgi:hypothetical protein